MVKIFSFTFLLVIKTENKSFERAGFFPAKIDRPALLSVSLGPSFCVEEMKFIFFLKYGFTSVISCPMFV